MNKLAMNSVQMESRWMTRSMRSFRCRRFCQRRGIAWTAPSLSAWRTQPQRPVWPPQIGKSQHRNDSTASGQVSPPPPLPSPNSVSAEEVSHFSRLASSWWSPHGPSRLLHLMNPLRHDFIQSCIRSGLEVPGSSSNGLSYLDVGCGGGIFASSAARLPSTSTVVAVDPTTELIQVAKTQQRSDPSLPESKLKYLNCAVEDLVSLSLCSSSPTSSSPSSLPLSDSPISTSTSTSKSPSNNSSNTLNPQDDPQPTITNSEISPPTKISKVSILTLFEVLEHVSSPSTFLSVATNHLEPQGWVIGSTIARSSISYLTTKLIAEAPLIGVVPAGTHEWSKYINPSELKEWFGSQRDGNGEKVWGKFKVQGVLYVPGLGWKMVNRTEGLGNYFFGVQKLL